MQNLFYVPPHQPRDIHPRTPGVKSVVKRNQPERLVFSSTLPGAHNVALPMPPSAHGNVDPVYRTQVLRRLMGRALIRLGHWITPNDGLNGQPLGQL